MTLSSMVLPPLISAALLALAGGRLGRKAIAVLACAAVALSLIAAMWASAPLLGVTYESMSSLSALDSLPQVSTTMEGVPYVQEHLYTWIGVGSLRVNIGFHLDAVSALMVLVVTFVGLLIHLYASGYMADDPDYGRFFCYMNLFVAAMLILVLADNLVLLYLGWEGVGACSYLLIGFWYREPANGYAARKAFVVTRVGDAALALGLFILARDLGTLRIDEVISGAARLWTVGDPTVTLVAALLLIGAAGKSAQLPLQVWLPDAMAGPAPVSALIHAATMVTAGVYLIARTHVIFLMAPAVMTAVAIIGTLTAFLAGCAALAQKDIKRVLAYSTISQIGYMFAALGVGAFAAAMFHLMTHAFFKALLFLSAGTVSHACHGETDLHRMGGLRHGRALPGTAALAAVGVGSLAGLPLITSGFYSKDAILWAALQPPYGHPMILAGLFVTAGLTALYAFRWYFMIFSGPAGPASRAEVHRPGALLLWPCVGLAAGALLAGFLETPETLGGYHALGDFLSPVFATAEHTVGGDHAGFASAEAAHTAELVLQGAAAAMSLIGVLLAYYFFVMRPAWLERLKLGTAGRLIEALWRSGWGFDAVYERAFVRPYVALAKLLRGEPIDDVVDAIAGTARVSSVLLSLTQTGRLRTYAGALVFGILLLLTIWLWP
jgi:NADH-quinone oxidoreductase subunit L